MIRSHSVRDFIRCISGRCKIKSTWFFIEIMCLLHNLTKRQCLSSEKYNKKSYSYHTCSCSVAEISVGVLREFILYYHQHHITRKIFTAQNRPPLVSSLPPVLHVPYPQRVARYFLVMCFKSWLNFTKIYHYFIT